MCRKLYLYLKLPIVGSILALFAISSTAWSTEFTIADGETETSQKTLATGETGTVDSGGALTVADAK